MDELTFQLAYGIFSASLVGVMLFLLARGLDRRHYLRPILYGFFLGIFCWVFFLAGVIAFFIGGCLVGYLLAREVGKWGKHLRAGALAGALSMPNLIYVPAAWELSARGLQSVLGEASRLVGRAVSAEELLASACFGTLFWGILLVFIVGIGAVLGGFLRKTLKPGEVKS